MSRNIQNVDEVFKKALDEYEEDVSPGVWNRIDSRLDKKKVISISRKYKRLQWAAALILSVSVSLAIYNNYSDKGLAGSADKSRKTIAKAPLVNTNAHSSQNASVNNIPPQVKPKTNDHSRNFTQQYSLAPTQNALEKTSNAAKYLSKKNVSSLRSSLAKLKRAHIKATLQELKRQLPANAGYVFKVGKFRVANKDEQNISIVSGKHAFSGTNNNQQEAQGEVTSVHLNTISGEGTLPAATRLPRDLPATAGTGIRVNDGQVRPLVADGLPVYESKHVQKVQQKKGMSIVSVTPFFSVDVVSNHIQQDRRMFREDDRNEIKQKENAGFSSSFGALASFNLKSGWSIQSGISVSTVIKNIEAKDIYARPDNAGKVRYRINCSAGYSFINIKSSGSPLSGDSIHTLASRNVLKYAGVPVIIKYTFYKRDFSFGLRAGLAINILAGGKIETDVVNGNVRESQVLNNIEGLKPSYFNGLLGVDAAYALNRNVAITFIPTGHFAISSINKNSPVKSYQNSFSLATGLIFRL